MGSVIQYLHTNGKTPLQIFYEMKYQSMEWKLPKGTIPNESKGTSFDPQGHANRLLGRRRHHTTCFVVVVVFACRHKHEQRILFRSHKVSKTGNGKEEKKQASKRTCPSPPRQCTAITSTRPHGNNRGMRPPTSWTSTLFPWLSSLMFLFFIFPEMKT